MLENHRSPWKRKYTGQTAERYLGGAKPSTAGEQGRTEDATAYAEVREVVLVMMKHY